jgi:hypothetical protein
MKEQLFEKVVTYEEFDYWKKEVTFFDVLIFIFGFLIFPFLYSIAINNDTMFILSGLGLVILFFLSAMKKRVVRYRKC